MNQDNKENQKCYECGSKDDLKKAYSEDEEDVIVYFCSDCYEENVNQ